MAPRVNFIAVVLATIASMLTSAVWYSPLLFASAWSRLSGVDNSSQKRKREFPRLMTIMFVVTLATAYVLACALSVIVSAYGGLGLAGALFAAAFLWLGFTGIRLYVNYSLDDQPLGLIAINAGNELITMLAMAAVIWAMPKV